MAITISKKLEKEMQLIAEAATTVMPVKKIKAKSETIVAAEELIDLNAKLVEMGAPQIIKRVDELKKILSSAIADAGADESQPYTFVTDMGTVEYSACSEAIEVEDKAAMVKALTPMVFMDVAKVSVTDLKTYLSLSEIAKFTKKVWGSRRIKSIVKKPEA